uniref:Uncharacterized protein n=1 Tax=Panagrolaimus sp. PS1159 TaxID=55785 RepID=A0AC35F595_9BILA
MDDQIPLLIRELSPQELKSIKQKIQNLYDEATKFDSDFSEMAPIPITTAAEIFKDYSNPATELKEIAKKNRVELRVIAQVFSDKIMKERYQYLSKNNPLRIVKEFDIDRPLLLDFAVLLRTVDEPTTVFICSINGLCITISQVLLSLSLLNTYLEDPLPTTSILSIPFGQIEDKTNLFMMNAGLLVDSMLALEDEEEIETNDCLNDIRFVSAAMNDVKEIRQRTKAIDNPLQSLHKFDLSVGNFLKFNSTKTVDNLKNNIKELENNRIRQLYPLATGEQLFQMIYNDIQDNMEVYAGFMKNNALNYYHGKIVKKSVNGSAFEVKLNSADMGTNTVLKVNRSALAYGKACDIDFPIGTRVIAYFKTRNRTEQRYLKNQWWPGTIGKDSNSDPNLEYLIFFDCDQEAYINRNFVRLHFDQAFDSKLDGEKYFVVPSENYSKAPAGRTEFLKNYLYSNRTIHGNSIGTTIAAINNRKVYQANILDIDRDLFLLRYNKTDRNTETEPGRGCTDLRCYLHNHFDEYVYRGSTTKLNPPDEKRTMRRNRFKGGPSTTTISSSSNDTKIPTARKSTSTLKVDASRSSSVFEDDDYDIKEKKEKAKKVKRMELKAPQWDQHFERTVHEKHGPNCLKKYVSKIKEISEKTWGKKFTKSPYFIPFANGWTRKTLVYSSVYSAKRHTKGYIVYESPCGESFHRIEQIAEYLQVTESKLPIFYFTFNANIKPEILCKEFYDGSLIDPDYAMGMEDAPIPVVNAVHPGIGKPKMVYNIKRYAHDENIKKLLQEFAFQTVCYCECKDDCSDPKKCSCQQLTYNEHARLDDQLQAPYPLYQNGCVDYKVQSGIYECNNLCHCKRDLCYNYVAQRKVIIPLQLFLTPQSGWGVRTLVDIPKGSFISTYSGEILNNALAEQLKHSDVYYAETDLIEDFENVKLDKGLDIPDEGVEIDMPQPTGPKDGIQLTDYFQDDLTFIVDAFDEGNIGRFFNHSCEPNMFVQNVFTDTHDLRLPCLAFFASREVKAGTELCWDYGYTNYDRKVRCHCGAAKCRGYLM